MLLIETEEQFNNFISQYNESSKAIFIPIFSDKRKHPQSNSLCVLFIHLIDSNEDFILSFNHDDLNTISTKALKLLDTDIIKYVYDKKGLLHMYPFTNVVDINLMFYYIKNVPLDISKTQTKTHSFYTTNSNRVIPITKHIERCQMLNKGFKKIVNIFSEPESFRFYNDIAIPALQKLESGGLCIDKESFNNQYDSFKQSFIDQNRIFTEYNPYTTTGRPSNKFGGINYAALEKNEGRRPFISRFDYNGLLVEFDYDAFHLHIIAHLVEYDLPKKNVHKYFANQYNIEDINEAKNLSFKLLYGGISKEYRGIPYFKKVDEYVKRNWELYNIQGYIESHLYKKKLVFPDSDLYPQKLFNYIIQHTEAEYGLTILNNIISFLSNHKSEVVLYTYDSFLIDFCFDDKDIINDIKTILEYNDNFSIKLKRGVNYSEMQ